MCLVRLIRIIVSSKTNSSSKTNEDETIDVQSKNGIRFGFILAKNAQNTHMHIKYLYRVSLLCVRMYAYSVLKHLSFPLRFILFLFSSFDSMSLLLLLVPIVYVYITRFSSHFSLIVVYIYIKKKI